VEKRDVVHREKSFENKQTSAQQAHIQRGNAVSFAFRSSPLCAQENKKDCEKKCRGCWNAHRHKIQIVKCVFIYLLFCAGHARMIGKLIA
jgi:hypothetical protein